MKQGPPFIAPDFDNEPDDQGRWAARVDESSSNGQRPAVDLGTVSIPFVNGSSALEQGPTKLGPLATHKTDGIDQSWRCFVSKVAASEKLLRLEPVSKAGWRLAEQYHLQTHCGGGEERAKTEFVLSASNLRQI